MDLLQLMSATTLHCAQTRLQPGRHLQSSCPKVECAMQTVFLQHYTHMTFQATAVPIDLATLTLQL